ncbi:MAG TPA: SH3 domain-containing protein, partial [Bacteroidales bacterium]|nr:SH3 domain-containing protein [Bacteroidales bacterium]
ASFSFAFAWKDQSRQTEKRNGIIFEPAVVVKSSPDEASVDLFVLHEGTKVEIQDKLDKWVKIKIANGNVGWLPATTLKEY